MRILKKPKYECYKSYYDKKNNFSSGVISVIKTQCKKLVNYEKVQQTKNSEWYNQNPSNKQKLPFIAIVHFYKPVQSALLRVKRLSNKVKIKN